MMYLQSNNPNNYGTVEFTSSIAKTDKTVEYRVVSVSTVASFSLTNTEDYMIIEIDNTKKQIQFEDKGSYEISDLSKLLEIHGITVKLNDKGLIELRANNSFKIIEASHRVQLLFGIYHQTFPIESQGNYIQSSSVPYLNQSQILYLLSYTDAICITNARGSEETQSIAFKIHELFINSYGFTSINNGNWFKIKASQLQYLKFVLVDFMLEPVILHAPLYITVEIVDERHMNERFKNIINEIPIASQMIGFMVPN